PLSRRVCDISASTEPRPGGWAAERSAERWDGMEHSEAGRMRPGLTDRGGRLRLLHSPRRAVRDLATHDTVVQPAYASVLRDRPSGANGVPLATGQVVDGVRDMTACRGSGRRVRSRVRRLLVLRRLGDPGAPRASLPVGPA